MHVLPFGAIRADDVERVGGKCAHLGELSNAGFPVPPGFAITTAAFDPGRAAMPPELAGEIELAYADLGKPPVAVRSSAVAEDASDASFAGMQSTYLWLRGLEQVLDGVERCWASYFNPEALSYREQHGGSEGMSVAVQLMVEPEVAGVMFTLNPVSGDRSSIAIEASYGLGVTVVGGEVTPDSYLYSKVTRELVRTQIGTKEIERSEHGVHEVDPERRARPCLEPDTVAAVAELGRRVEQHYGRPQDLEWAIDRDDRLFLLQARPETVWSQRPTPAAAPSALAAIAATFTGERRPR
jgi:pyruvate,water dikinase